MARKISSPDDSASMSVTTLVTFSSNLRYVGRANKEFQMEREDRGFVVLLLALGPQQR